MGLKNKIFLVCLFVNLLTCFSSDEDSLQFQKDMYKVQYQSTLVLLEWSIINIGVSSIGSKKIFTPVTSNDYFHQSNFYWNLINSGIVGFNYSSLRRMNQKSWSLKELQKRKTKTQRALAVNIGLDFLYIAYGLILKQSLRSTDLNYSSYQGNGNSLILQGSFLLVFDTFFLRRFNNINSSYK